jgi:hypothetical protein
MARTSVSRWSPASRGRRAGRILLGILLALLAYLLLTLPPRPRASVPSSDAAALAAPVVLRGAYHIHTTASDGTGSMDEVAAAAARAGLQFIIVTDHGDGTRTPLPPAYRSGVLCVDAVEISTTGGHYAALGLAGATPYRLAGEPRDVVEDVHRFGGFGIAAHPDSPKRELQWTGWDTPFDGLEWLNEDTEWRDESYASLLRAALHYTLRPAEALGALANHARGVLDHWDALTPQRRIIGLVAVDAHARLGLGRGREPYAGTVLLRVPSYEASFRSFSLHLEMPAAPSGDAARDAAGVLQAIRSGHVYATLDALAQPGPVGFTASSGTTAAAHTARMGDFLPPDGPVTWDAAAAAPAEATLRLLCDGRIVKEVAAPARLHYEQQPAKAGAPSASLPASCRLEVGWDRAGTRITWLATNPIYLRAADPPPPAIVIPPAQQAWRVAEGRGKWLVEHDPQTKATAGLAMLVDPAGPATELSFALRPGQRVSQYAALVTLDVGAIAQATRVAFTAWANRPMRISVQVRVPIDEIEGERWQRSVYVDTQKRDVTIPFEEMTAVGVTSAVRPPVAKVQSLMFVVDMVNTQPGASGRLDIGQVRLER